MVILEEPIEFFVEKMRNQEHYSLVGYSDAEFFCMMGIRIGNKTGLGQLLTVEQGEKLLEIMRRRQHQRNFCFAIPKCLYDIPAMGEGRLEEYLRIKQLNPTVYERDMITDDLAKDAGLFPLIKQLRESTVTLIGNRELLGADLGFPVEQFIGISSPNLHKKPREIDRVITQCLRNRLEGVYLVGAGVSAPVIIDKLHDHFARSFFFDCGSMWDAFAGIGGQRQWRTDLCADPAKHREWVRKNIYGP